MSSKNKRDRLTLDFPAGAKEKFEKVRLLANLSTIIEVFRHAISTYEFLLEQQQAGWRVVLEKQGEDKEVFRIT